MRRAARASNGLLSRKANRGDGTSPFANKKRFLKIFGGREKLGFCFVQEIYVHELRMFIYYCMACGPLAEVRIRVVRVVCVCVCTEMNNLCMYSVCID